MCGIAGLVATNPSLVKEPMLRNMTDAIVHRGPDGEGVWISENGCIGLGHRRLSIIDLSVAGAQPMTYGEGRYTITFNGEIYNYIEIKAELSAKGYSFRSDSDTEVILALYDLKREKCLSDLDGMFSFAIYDAREETLFCARDRFGEKPFFYFYEAGKTFCFASEMKALWAGGIKKEVDHSMLFNYLSYGFLENANDKTQTFYRNIQKLESAHYLIIDTNTLSVKKGKYWDIDIDNIDRNISEKEASSKFQELFYDSVRKRLRSDVPVGSSLSGGLDSSLVVCVINELLKGTEVRQKTFSARFPGYKLDEGYFMEKVVESTHAEAHYTYPNELSLIEKIDKVAYHQEEPFGSASILVQYDVMKLAKDNGVIVLLDGQGADEILAGYHYYYNSYFNELRSRDKEKYRNAISRYMTLHADNQINAKVNLGLNRTVKRMFPGVIKPYFSIRNRIDQMLNPTFNKDYYQHYSASEHLGNNLDLHSSKSLNQALYYSTFRKGLSELLRYSDRNSMAQSREVRLPFLSHHLVEFLFTLPAELKINEGWTKYIMRVAFDHILPKEIAWRKDKIGYEPPQQSWMEAKSVKEKIYDSKQLLVNEGVLNKIILAKENSNADANEKNWKFWMAANLLNQGS